ncbi:MULTISPECIES: energy transducer TonB [Butyricimonas]|uniref:energy transducer TonB n=1 Tax=Butyricimonas TaxID=574697 RepID=UPI001D0778D1|nr:MULTISPECIES: energy transducer TonB [Butyricimonas]MCB6974397.1 TonB family protein [Butyricimonas synergistica]MCG4521239.1 TonB family protein [Butyricimonas sp. DFI.6.44]
MGLVKYALLFPVVGLLILSSNVQAIVQQNGEYASVVGKDSIVAKGIVMDADNKPLKNVILVIRETNIGTFTNEKGEFTITVKPGAELFFSYVGKKGQLRKVNDEKRLVVKMENDLVSMEEVIVVSSYDTTGVSKDIFVTVEDMPEFPGNINEYLGKNVKYPVEAQKQKIQGRVIVQFVIEKDGTISEVKALRPVHPLLDAEAMRVVKAMPKWKPGTQRGEPVRVSYSMPINFRLQ